MFQPWSATRCRRCGVKCENFSALLAHYETVHPEVTGRDQPAVGHDQPAMGHDQQAVGDDQQVAVDNQQQSMGKNQQSTAENTQPKTIVIKPSDSASYRCSRCSRLFSSEWNLRSHDRKCAVDYAKDTVTPHRCRLCGKHFDSALNLQTHITKCSKFLR